MGRLLWSMCGGNAEKSCVFGIAFSYVGNDSGIYLSYSIQ